jgi:hypothetical protein
VQVSDADGPTLKMLDVIQGEIVRVAFLEIARKDGPTVRVDTPLRFFRRHLPDRDLTVEIIVNNIREIINNAKNKTEVKRIAIESEMIASTIQSCLTQLNDQNIIRELENIVVLSITLGEYYAKAKSATTIEPIAIIGERSLQKSRDGGIKSGNTRRNAPWKITAKYLAIRERNKVPSLSQDNLATEVAALWQCENIPPTHKTIKRFIAELEQEGSLSKRRAKP